MSADVDAWLDAQDHAVVAGARSVRAAILGAHPDVAERIKWQAPSFAMADDFATFSMRRPGLLQVILHTGAKPRPELASIRVDDLDGRLRWAGHNRAIVAFTSDDEVAAALPRLGVVVRDWIAQS